MQERRVIEVRGFKWPRRPAAVTNACLIGEDEFGRWLGIAKGSPWWAIDGSRSGVFETSLVKVVPSGGFWTACFCPVDPVVDVDIVLPVQWVGDVLEEVDLELDVLRWADGSVSVRDVAEFRQVREAWAIPGDIVARAEEACKQIREMVEQGVEPFGGVGGAWLACFIAEQDQF